MDVTVDHRLAPGLGRSGICVRIRRTSITFPLVDLKLARNRALIGATVGILIGSGTINGLMFLVSLYFQDPATLGMTALQAGLATIPATAGSVILAPLVPKIAIRIGTRQAIGLGFIIMTGGFALMIGTSSSWGYAAFVIPLVAVAVGLALCNGPCSSIATSAVPKSRSGPPPGSRTWPVTWGPRCGPPSSPRSTTPSAPIRPPPERRLETAWLRRSERLPSSSPSALPSESSLPGWPDGTGHRRRWPWTYAAAAAASTHTLPTPHPTSAERVGAGSRSSLHGGRELLGGYGPEIHVERTTMSCALRLEESVAFAATIVFRVITFYLPAVEGFFGARWLEQHGYI